jgi:mannose/fructose/N-acetylgalactosamine-specific phosphotransferase system component IID
MLGTGLGFALDPALRRLPGGKGGEAYRRAIVRQSTYFNAHPYMTGLAAGALARAELDGVAHDRIVRFRTALCGPLGSLGDRIVWAGLLPCCSLIALALYGIGAGALQVVLAFLLTYNAGHLFLRFWGLNEGWRHGLGVSKALGEGLTYTAPAYISRAGALLAGVSIPLVLQRLTGSGIQVTVFALAGAVVSALLLVRLGGRVEGWRASLVVLTVYALLAVMI